MGTRRRKRVGRVRSRRVLYGGQGEPIEEPNDETAFEDLQVPVDTNTLNASTVVEVSKSETDARNKLNASDDTKVKAELKKLQDTLDQKSKTLIESITTEEGKYEANAVRKANMTLDKRLAAIESQRASEREKLDRMAPPSDVHRKELEKLELNFEHQRESAYMELNTTLGKVTADLHAIASRQANKIHACAPQNTILQDTLAGLMAQHEENLTALRKTKAELLLADHLDPPAIPAPSVEHVRNLFTYMLLHTAKNPLPNP